MKQLQESDLKRTSFTRVFNEGKYNAAGNTPGERIRWARLQLGFTQEAIYHQYGVSVGDLERNRVIPLIRTIKKLSTILQQPIWFLGCYEMMPESTFWERLEKARYYHGHTKEERAKSIRFNQRNVSRWKINLPSKNTLSDPLIEIYLTILLAPQ
jgi:transcriptional regulator with XRE-family HTH domain